MSYEQHQQSAKPQHARCAILTLSDTRDKSNDTSGAAIDRLLKQAGHEVIEYTILRDEPVELEARLRQLLSRDDVDAIFTNGGTGISRRDATISVVERMLVQPLPGFGELFRMLSWDQIGSGAMLSRATGGVANNKLLFAMPGSTKAVELAMTKLILPELKHLLFELRR